MPLVSALVRPHGRVRRWLQVPLGVSLAAHLYGLYTPGEPDATLWFAHADKLWHFVGFAIPSVLAVLLTRRWWPIAGFAANAALSELVQQFWLPFRDGDWFDLLTDLAGLLPALLLLLLLRLQAASSSMAESSPTNKTSAASRRPNA